MRILRGITDELSPRGNVLAVGDSTSAYCVDRERELSWSDLRGKARDACGGVNFYFESWSGATPRSFFTHANNAAWWGALVLLDTVDRRAEFRRSERR